MKGKSKYLVLLLLLLVVCSGLVTYAIYRTNKSGNANINAARWNVVFKNGEEEISNNFDISLNNATWKNDLGNVATGKIAPGSYATFYITIDASNTETSVDYTAEIEDSFNETDFDVTLADDAGTIPYSTTSGAMIRQIPIQVVWNGNINDNDNKNSDDLLKKARNITIPIKLTAAQKLALKYTVTFNDGIGNTISSRKVNEGEAIGTLPANPTRLGYIFAGWYDDPTNGSQVTTETLVNSGMNIYAHWTIKYVTVTFDSNGGSTVSSQQVQEGSTINPLPTTSKSGNDFLGWFDSNDNKLTTLTKILNDITYTASWYNAYTNAGTLVYYDPVSSSLCDENHTESSTCYKWYIIKEEGNNAVIQLDHNLINTAAWDSGDYNNNGPDTILQSLATATTSWKSELLLNYEYDTSDLTQNYGKLTCVNGECTISKTDVTISNVKTRLITKEEYNAIPNDKSWLYVNTTSSSNGGTNNTYDSNNQGYWTLSPVPNNYNLVYLVSYNGTISDGYCDDFSHKFGARPVITVSKTNLNY